MFKRWLRRQLEDFAGPYHRTKRAELNAENERLRKVVDAAENHVAGYCGVTLNYAGDPTLRILCEALQQVREDDRLKSDRSSR